MINYANSSLQLGIDWRIKRDPVYRLLDNITYAEKFFSTGEIMLSSFQKFKQYPNEIQGDVGEGHGFAHSEDLEGNTHIVVYESGENGYVMSTTKILNKEIITDFNSTCAIKINNPTMFGLELCKKIPFVSSGVEGECIYTESKITAYKNEYEKFKGFDFERNRVASEAVFREITSGIELFSKLNQYKNQNEYRFIWFSDYPILDTIVVKCPEASKYCELIKFNE